MAILNTSARRAAGTALVPEKEAAGFEPAASVSNNIFAGKRTTAFALLLLNAIEVAAWSAIAWFAGMAIGRVIGGAG